MRNWPFWAIILNAFSYFSGGSQHCHIGTSSNICAITFRDRFEGSLSAEYSRVTYYSWNPLWLKLCLYQTNQRLDNRGPLSDIDCVPLTMGSFSLQGISKSHQSQPGFIMFPAPCYQKTAVNSFVDIAKARLCKIIITSQGSPWRSEQANNARIPCRQHRAEE